MGPHGEGGPGGRGFHGGPASRWWMDARMAQRVGLTDEQKKRMDAVFQPSRLKLIDLTAALQREEAILEPLLAVDQPEDAQVLPQLDRVVQARGELEKARAKMLLGFRRVLTPEQWKKLQHGGPPAPPPPPGDRR
ncbi:MAG: periplasmic heavy metal sensor [Acidobacteria bacterium]|nr:periplasmic heavy metal sensor [Acidobacteriota bacterium]